MTAAKKKPGRVVRLDPATVKYIDEHRKTKETTTALVRRLIGLPGRKGSPPEISYVLPSLIDETLALAKGRAVMRAVRSKTKPERPVPVRRID